MTGRLLAVLFIGALAASARAWDRHAVLTAAALKDVPGLDAKTQAETLPAYLSAVGYAGGVPGFLAVNLINPTITAPFLLGERPGSLVALREVIAGYADEPDWGMDQDLFSFYPQLWKPDYEYMIGKNGGAQTRVFRHSYWPFGYLKPSAAPPPKAGAASSPPGGQPVHEAAPMGEAPERAQLFFEESRKAFAAGHPYWGARFLSWSLHYLEDVGQPFHATQIPSTAFLQFKPSGELDLEASVRTVAYYHLVMDSFPAQAAQGSLGPQAQRLIERSLSTTTTVGFVSARQLAQDAARASARKALKTADAVLDFFPQPSASDLADPLKRAYDPALWTRISQDAKTDPALAQAYENMLSGLLSACGANARALTQHAVAAIPAPPSLSVRRAPLPAKVLARVESLAARLLGR